MSLTANQKAYRLEHRAEILARQQAARNANREELRLKERAYYAARRELILAKKSVWRKTNRRKLTVAFGERRRKNPTFKVRTNLARRINLAVRGFAKKAATTLNLVGCLQDELCAHLESKFLPGMTWENYGPRGWHIDHIRPCASFNLLDPEQQRACFHYTNLQPLWSVDNHKKGAKIL